MKMRVTGIEDAVKWEQTLMEEGTHGSKGRRKPGGGKKTMKDRTMKGGG